MCFCQIAKRWTINEMAKIKNSALAANKKKVTVGTMLINVLYDLDLLYRLMCTFALVELVALMALNQ